MKNSTIALLGILVLSSSVFLQGYSHVIKNTSGVPVVVRLYTIGGLFARVTVEPSTKIEIPGSFIDRIVSIEAAYRGSDPRYSGLNVRWTPRGTPPPSTRVFVQKTRWKYDPDGKDDDGYDIWRPDPERHINLAIIVEEIQ